MESQIKKGLRNEQRMWKVNEYFEACIKWDLTVAQAGEQEDRGLFFKDEGTEIHSNMQEKIIGGVKS